MTCRLIYQEKLLTFTFKIGQKDTTNVQQLLFEDLLDLSRHLQVNEYSFCSIFIYLSSLSLKYSFNRISMVVDIETIHNIWFNFLKSISHLIILNIF